MAKPILGNLIKRRMLDVTPADIENAEQEALDTRISNALVRGTDEPTAVDNGSWLKIYKIFRNELSGDMSLLKETKKEATERDLQSDEGSVSGRHVRNIIEHDGSLTSATSVLIYGRVVLSDLDLNRPKQGYDHFWLNQPQVESAKLARIYGFSYEGQYVDVIPPAIFLVHGDGNDPEAFHAAQNVPAVMASHGSQFAEGIRVWPYEKDDFTTRLDPMSGTFEEVMLRLEEVEARYLVESKLDAKMRDSVDEG